MNLCFELWPEGAPQAPHCETVSQYEKTVFSKKGGAVGWKRFRAVTFNPSDVEVPRV